MLVRGQPRLCSDSLSQKCNQYPKLRQEDCHKCEANLSYLETLCLKNMNKRAKTRGPMVTMGRSLDASSCLRLTPNPTPPPIR